MSYLNGLRVRIEGPIVFWPSTVSGIRHIYQFEAHGAEKINKIIFFFLFSFLSCFCSCTIFFVLVLFDCS